MTPSSSSLQRRPQPARSKPARRTRRPIVATAFIALLLVGACATDETVATQAGNTTNTGMATTGPGQTTPRVTDGTATTGSEPTETSAPPNEECPGVGVLQQIGGLNVAEVLRPQPRAMASRKSTRELYDESGNAPPPDGFQVRDWQSPFDWDGDGQSETLTFDTPNNMVSVNWGSGSLNITGIDSGHYGGNPASPRIHNAAVGDVTGDNKPDLIVARESAPFRMELRVLVGNGPGTSVAGTIDSADIGTKYAGWTVTATRLVLGGKDAPVEPRGSGEPLLVWDADGDTINDFAFRELPPRSIGTYVWYAGRPCAWRPPT